jgi:hypothetical protein
MTDPKLNELADEIKPEARDVRNETASRAAAPRSGLSVNDTIAGDVNLSVGGRGVDTSGVRAGAGAGAGSTHLSPAHNNSPAPAIEAGPTGSGTTPLSQNVSGDSQRLSHDEIARHAYRCWLERGCPEGSAEEDWHRAERELAGPLSTPRSSVATA